MKRLFVGFPVTSAVRNRLAEWVVSQQSPDKIKWVDPKNYHMTLVFLGETDVSTIPMVEKAIYDIVKRNAPNVVYFDRLEQKPRKTPHLIWARWRTPKPLIQMQHELMQRLINPDYVEKRPWIGHTTLARFRHEPRNIHLNVDWEIKMPINRLVLYESELHPKGARYNELKSFTL